MRYLISFLFRTNLTLNNRILKLTRREFLRGVLIAPYGYMGPFHMSMSRDSIDLEPSMRLLIRNLWGWRGYHMLKVVGLLTLQNAYIVTSKEKEQFHFSTREAQPLCLQIRGFIGTKGKVESPFWQRRWWLGQLAMKFLRLFPFRGLFDFLVGANWNCSVNGHAWWRYYCDDDHSLGHCPENTFPTGNTIRIF